MKNQKTEQTVESMELTTMNGKLETITFFDTKLIEHTKNIQSLRDMGNKTMLAIAYEFNSMDMDESYKTAGFKTVADYGRVVFDYKHSTVSLYLRSAKAFLEKDDKGQLKMRGILPWMTIGQMIELLPLVKNETDITTVENAFKDTLINQNMSTKKLRDAVNGIRGIAQKDTIEKTPLEKASKMHIGENGELPKGKNRPEVVGVYVDAVKESMDAIQTLAVNADLDPVAMQLVVDKIHKITEMVAEIATTITE